MTFLKLSSISLLMCLAASASVTNAQGRSDCKDLASAIGVDTVVTPTDANYDQSRSQFASELGSYDLADAILAPDAIIYAQTEDDIRAVLEFADHCKYKVAVRSGGHQYAGYSSCQAGDKRWLSRF